MLGLQGIVAAILVANGLYFFNHKRGLAYINFGAAVLAVLIGLL